MTRLFSMIWKSTLLLTLWAGLHAPAYAAAIIFSTEFPEAVDGPGGTTTAFADDDFVRYDLDTNTGTIEILGSTINPNPSPTIGLPDPNALFVRDNGDGNIIFSVQSGSLNFPGGFNDDDLIEYDRTTGNLTTLFSFDGVMTADGGRDVDIDGFHLLDNGNFLIANTFDFTLGGMSFRNGDIALYDPVLDTATLFFTESLFGGVDARITSLTLNDTGNLIISAFNEDTGGSLMLGGQTFGRGDLVEYDATLGSGSLFFPATNFTSGTADFDALHFVGSASPPMSVPEPGTLALLTVALAGVASLRRRRLES